MLAHISPKPTTGMLAHGLVVAQDQKKARSSYWK